MPFVLSLLVFDLTPCYLFRQLQRMGLTEEAESMVCGRHGGYRSVSSA